MNVNELINRDIVCSCGRTHRCDIGALAIGEGVLDKLPQLLCGRERILVVADGNTRRICLDRVERMLGERIIGVCVLEGEGVLVPNEESIAAVDSMADGTDFILGIGSGVINDLCKYVAFGRGIRSGIIATAPSMDGYASSGAAMIIGGMKITYTVNAPDLIVGDADILANAPIDMIRSGYADIIGKYSALCDWRLSELVNGEYLCPYVYGIVMDMTNEVRSLAPLLAKRERAAVIRLMEALVLIGVCLTLLSTTRPGSGSEHHLSHFFEVTGLIRNKPYFLHGTDVGYSTVVTAAIRERIRAVSEPIFSHVSDDEKTACYDRIYGDYASEVAKIQNAAGWYTRDLDKVYVSNWKRICEILAECPPASEIERMLTDVGFDMTEFAAMYGEEKIRDATLYAKDLKDRYSVLWLYFSLRLQ